MITDKLRNIGIDIVGDAPWGTHFCQFYKTKQDLIDILVPYFKAGLENNEYCMWITSEPLSEEDAKEALEKAVPNIHNYLEQGQIEILPYTEWYVIEGSFNSDKVLDGWISKLDQALTHGYDGLRLSGNTFWLEKEGWDDFVDYEEAVDNVIGQYRMLALCTYCLDKCTAAEIIDVVNNHEFALTKREGNWDLIENSEHKQKEALIWNQKRNELLIDITSRLLNSEDPQTIIYDICQKTMEFLQCDVFFNYLVNEKKGRLHLNAYGGIPEKDAQKIEWLDYGVAVCGYVALEARRIIEENIFETADERTDHVEAYGVQAYACHPLMVEDKSIGTLSFGTKSRVSFTDRELEVMKAVSDQISIAMSRLISNRALKEAHDNLEEQVEERTQELELASAYNRSLIEASLDPLVTIGRDGKITDINASTEAVTGFNRDDLVGTDFSDYFTEPEKAREGYKQVFREGEVRDYELEIRHKNGQLTPVLYNASAYRDESGEVIGIFAAARDINGIKQAENKLKVSIDELKRSNKELESFAFITSHDLQEPLRTMGSYAGLLKRRYNDKLGSDADEFIEFMVSGALRMQDMIKGLLEYSRAGTQGGEFRNFNTEEALKSALSNLKSFIEENSAEVTYDSLPEIYADENQITRVFQNFIGNAIKFKKLDEPPKIHISASLDDDKNEYVFSVSDNGIGIEPQYIDRIFEVFKRLHSIGEYEGAGIGLAIAKRIIDRHRGLVWVESEYGKGSTFYFTIPINK